MYLISGVNNGSQDIKFNLQEFSNSIGLLWR